MSTNKPQCTDGSLRRGEKEDCIGGGMVLVGGWYRWGGIGRDGGFTIFFATEGFHANPAFVILRGSKTFFCKYCSYVVPGVRFSRNKN